MDNIHKKMFLNVNKPARYTGGEYNLPNMYKNADVRVCICFPDIYEIAMSNLGLRILYHMLNDRNDCVAERCFCPWHDMINELKNENIPLFSIETSKPLREFDILGFSIQYELSYTNIVLMMDLANFPLYAIDRDETYPLIIAGGPCMANPEPFSEYFDVMVVGDGEEALMHIVDRVKLAKQNKTPRNELLLAMRDIEGVIVPSLDKPIYEEIKITGFTRIVNKAVVKDLDKAYFPTSILLPNIEAVHDRAILELYRGCANGCRFCQAGFYYRPMRARSIDNLCNLGKELIEKTGFEELSLASLSTGDYPNLLQLISNLKASTTDRGTRIALPSMRLDSFDENFTSEARKSSLTFAPEAGTQRLRDVINKNITDEDIDNTIRSACKVGYTTLKLYFIIGLPTETMEDIDGIIDIVKRVCAIYRERGRMGKLKITVSTAVFIPKPVTPFQWEGQLAYDEIDRRQSYLRSGLKLKGVSYSWHSKESALLEAVFARGDRKLSGVIKKAYELGARFDSWSEHFKFDIWQQAFDSMGIDISDYTKEQDTTNLLPYEYIDTGIRREYFIQERNKAYEGVLTPSCKDSCCDCGANKYGKCGL